jgi:hypothetical protein
VNLGVLLIDRVGSTKESQTLPPEALSRRQAQYYAGVEEIARAYGAYDRFNWQGDGLMLLFWTADPGSLARLVAGVGIELWQRQLDLGMQVRIAGHVVAGVEWNPDPGKLTHREINLCGHLEKDAPDGSLVISEDIYWQLTPGEQSRFGPLGESKRDATPAYCYPSGRASEAFHFSSEHALWEKFRRYSLGPEISSMRCIGFPLQKQVPRDLQVEEVFVLPNFEFVQNPALAYEAALSKSAAPGTLSITPVAAPPDLLPADDSSAFGAVLGRRRGLVVLGEPGSGKTTLLRWLAIVAARGRYSFQRSTGLDERRLPMPISVGRLAEIKSTLGVNCSVPQALARYFQDRSIGTADEILAFLEAALQKAHCLVLFAGLDEVAGNRVEITSWLEAFASVYPGNRYVASSRVRTSAQGPCGVSGSVAGAHHPYGRRDTAC